MTMVAVLDEENLTFLCHTSMVVLGVINQEALASNDFWIKKFETLSGAVRGSDYISVSLSYSSENLSSGRKTSALRLFIGVSSALVRLLGCCGASRR